MVARFAMKHAGCLADGPNDRHRRYMTHRLATLLAMRRIGIHDAPFLEAGARLVSQSPTPCSCSAGDQTQADAPAATVTPERTWTQLYIRRAEPAEAAKYAEREYWSTRPAWKTKTLASRS